ncbi:MAG: PIN domain-containing protein [Verrucomicrobiaceae bacterium]|nr:PIN domain-containing protein [Verrucomicrobiaceae bacterium]
MSYSIDANLLLYASNTACDEHAAARAFVLGRVDDPDLFCLTWPTVFAYLRIVTHPSIFRRPLSPETAWSNLRGLMDLPRVCLIGEEEDFLTQYELATQGVVVRGNLVPDAHLAALLHQHGVNRLYSADTDFRKFRFLEVINPLETP